MGYQKPLAYGIVYIVLGSTYLAIALAVRDLPPLWMAGVRFFTAGVILWVIARPQIWPTAADWRHAFITGGLMLAIGNGTLSVVETKMPSGIAALIVATVPVWMVVLDAVATRRRPGRVESMGLVAALVGVAVLSSEDAGWRGGVDPVFVMLLAAGAFAWALGSLHTRASNVESLRTRTAMQMLAGGATLLVMALADGEPVAWTAVRASSWWALAYLIVFGSIVAYTAYLWLLKTQPAAAVATYAFVNPVVALVLGMAVLSEPLTFKTLAASLLIVGAVVVINRATAHRVRDQTA